MSARRLRSFRAGDRSEVLAEYFLSDFAIVNTVARQNDFGLDHICFLTQEEGDYVFSGSSFGVQTKSHRHQPIRFGGMDSKTREWREWEINWLFGQDFPLLIAVVDRKRLRLRLYSTARMWWLLWMRGLPHEVILKPGADLPGLPTHQRFERKRIRRKGGDGYQWVVPLGAPIIDVTLNEPLEPVARANIQKTLQEWLRLDHLNIRHRKMGTPYTVEFPAWEANLPPLEKPKEWNFANPQLDWNVREILRAIRPGLTGLAFNLRAQEQFAKNKALKPLARLLKDYDLEDEKLKRFLAPPPKPHK